MIKNYNLKTRLTLVVACLLLTFGSWAQTTLINPSTDGGFESGSNFAANGWNVSNVASNQWVVGTAVSNGLISGNSAYISNSGGVSNDYSNTTIANNFFWKDVTVPAGETKITLTFNWLCQGESTWDLWQVFTAPVSVVPAATSTYPGSGASNVPAAITGASFVGNGSPNATVQTATYLLPASLAGTTFRLIFSWKNDGGGGTPPPAVIDNVSLVSQVPGTFISVATGNWTSPATWDANAVPTYLDNAIIDVGHTVTIDASSLSINDLTVRGTLGFGTTPTSFSVNGNLTVNSGGLFNVFNGTTGKTLSVAKNITNNGLIDVSVGTTTAGNLTLSGSTVQTVSGTGSFNNGFIRNITFSNSNTSIPNINWGINTNVAYNLNLTGARINLGTSKMTFGNGAAGNTLTAPVGTGFLSGSKFSRWWTTTATGTAITAGTDPTNATSRYPFINAAGENRAIYISRSSSTGTGNTAGELAVVYTDGVGTTTGLSVVDGAYTITDRYNGHWSVSTEGSGYVYVSGTHTVAAIAQNAYFTSTTNSRIMTDVAVAGGTHQNGTLTPGAQRVGLTTSDLTVASGLYMGINSADIPFVSVQSGDWNNPATWNKGTLPTCADAVIIANGHTVNNNSSANVCKNLTINSGGVLLMSSGDLTVGCTLNNNPLVVNGTLTVNAGTLTIKGNLNIASATAVFNQSGGTIQIDGNAAGVLANSVASGTPLFNSVSTNLNLTGGTLLFVDPHPVTTASSAYTIYLNNGTPSTTTLTTSSAHTIQFGDGVSTDAGGTTNGFFINNWAGSAYLSMGSVVINGGAGTNRMVTSNYQLTVNGNLTINTSSTLNLGSTLFIGGNLTVNAGGTFINTATVTTGVITSNTTTVLTPGPAVNAQTFTNNGTCANLAVSPTANLTSLTVNNTSVSGLTLASPFSVSGTLTLTTGVVNTTGSNLLTLGTATAAGTLTGGGATSYIKGPFARTIASGNANTNYISYPVGKTAYAPVWLAPATTAVSVMRAEAFDSNTGTTDASITSLSATRRWEAPLTSGTITNLNVRLGDAGIVSTNIPVQAPSAAGIYTNAFGSVATFATGTPNTTQSNTPIVSGSYTGYLSYAISNACSGTPTPGNTISTANNICLGNSVLLSLQNSTPGTGVSYSWESSSDGISYSAIGGATNSTYSTIPSVATYYRCQVTCSGNTGTSTPVYITFANQITSTTPATRCGTGTVSLLASAASGTLSWYGAASGGSSIGSGSPFTTPSIASTTTYYVASESYSPASVTLGAGATTSSSYDGIFYHLYGGVQTQFLVRASELTALGLGAGNITSLSINMASVTPQSYNNFAIEMMNTSNTAMAGLVTGPYTSVYSAASYSPVTGNNTFTFSTPYNWDGSSNLIIKMCWSNNNTGGTSNYAKVDNPGFVSTAYYRADNASAATICGATTATSTNSLRPQFVFAGQTVCSSPRVPVVATVNAPPAFALSSNAISTCQGVATSAVTITTGAADYDTYTWSPSANVSGDAINGWTFNPASTTTFVLTPSQSSGAACATTATVNVTVNQNPSTLTVTPSAPSVCVNGIVQLTAAGGVISATGTIGTATTLTGATSQPTAFCNRWPNYWSQTIYTAAELAAAGLSAGNINSMAYNVASLGDAATNANFTIKIGTVGSATFGSTTFLSTASYTTVYGPATYTHTSSGWNTINFTTPFVWDGVSNIIINVTHDGADAINNSQTYYTATSGNTTLWATSYTGSTTTGTLSVNRLNVRFTVGTPTVITWSPATNLYTDATATTSYVAGAAANSVYYKSSTAGSTVYTATSTATATGCSSSGIATVTVNALPTVTATSNDADNTVCANTMVTLTGGGATSYTWDNGVSDGVAFAATTTTTYNVTGTDGNGCSNTANITLTVNTLPTVTATSDDADNTVCENTMVTLTGGGATSYTWDNGVNDGVAFAATSTTTYNVTGTDGNGCSNTSNITLTVNALPTVTATSDDADNAVCENTMVTLTGGGATSYTWDNGVSDGVAFVPTTTTTYNVTGTDGNGCSNTANITLTVNTLPTVTATSDDADNTVCENTMVTLTGGGATSYTWDNGVSDGVAFAVASTTTYNVTGTDGNGCSNTANITLTVNTLPTVTASSDDADNAICQGLMITLNGGGADTYTWDNGVTDGASFAPTATTVYSVTGTDLNGCSNTATITITVNTPPTVDLAPFTSPVCDNGGIVSLTDGTPTGGTFSGLGVSGNTFDPSAVSPGLIAITYSVTDGNGCIGSDIENIQVDLCTGIASNNSKFISLYPNPTTGLFTVVINNANNNQVMITIVDMQGKVVFNESDKNVSAQYNKQIDLTDLAKGIYYVKLNIGADVKIEKLIVQ